MPRPLPCSYAELADNAPFFAQKADTPKAEAARRRRCYPRASGLSSATRRGLTRGRSLQP